MEEDLIHKFYEYAKELFIDNTSSELYKKISPSEEKDFVSLIAPNCPLNNPLPFIVMFSVVFTRKLELNDIFQGYNEGKPIYSTTKFT
jgi:hypothetical protein